MGRALGAFLFLLLCCGAAYGQQRNIVMIVADDHGCDTGAYGNADVVTPHLDALAAEGTRFEHAFATTASCSSSRSVILTGLHNHKTGQYGLEHSYHHFRSHENLLSLPQRLSDAGYHTVRIGKYHVSPAEAYPFETALQASSRNPVAMANACRPVFEAADDRPFFLYYATSDPHRGGKPGGLDPSFPDRFGNRDRGYAGVEEVVFDPTHLQPPAWLPDSAATRAELAQYYQSIARVDQGVGRLLELLDESGKAKHTLVLYLSDHGAAFCGAKTTVYEPGLRSPLIVRRPGAAAGVVSKALVSWVDLAPTLLEWAGLAREGMHGRSFLDCVGDASHDDRFDEVYASHTFHEVTMYYPMRVVRERRFKLIWNLAHPLPFPTARDLWQSATWQFAYQQGMDTPYGLRTIGEYMHRPQFELYDLRADPWEANNLAEDPAHAATLQRLKEKLHAFQDATGDPWKLKRQHE